MLDDDVCLSSFLNPYWILDFGLHTLWCQVGYAHIVVWPAIHFKMAFFGGCFNQEVTQVIPVQNQTNALEFSLTRILSTTVDIKAIPNYNHTIIIQNMQDLYLATVQNDYMDI